MHRVEKSAVTLGLHLARKNEETLISSVGNVRVDQDVIGTLSSLAKETVRRRIRLCAHQNEQEAVHEMFIVHPRRAYVPPHKHQDKSESIFILSGECDYFIFDENGDIREKIKMGDYYSEKPFFFRQQNSEYHSLLIHSPELIFLEITKGPFHRKDTVEAPWAPNAASQIEVERFHARLENWTAV